MKLGLFFLFAALALFACSKGSHSGNSAAAPDTAAKAQLVTMDLLPGDTTIYRLNFYEGNPRKLGLYALSDGSAKLEILQNGQPMTFTALSAQDFNASEHDGRYRNQGAATLRVTQNGIVTNYEIGADATWYIDGQNSTSAAALTDNMNRLTRNIARQRLEKF